MCFPDVLSSTDVSIRAQEAFTDSLTQFCVAHIICCKPVIAFMRSRLLLTCLPMVLVNCHSPAADEPVEHPWLRRSKPVREYWTNVCPSPTTTAPRGCRRLKIPQPLPRRCAFPVNARRPDRCCWKSSLLNHRRERPERYPCGSCVM